MTNRITSILISSENSTYPFVLSACADFSFNSDFKKPQGRQINGITQVSQIRIQKYTKIRWRKLKKKHSNMMKQTK